MSMTDDDFKRLFDTSASDGLVVTSWQKLKLRLFKLVDDDTYATWEEFLHAASHG